jgi:hypothetical protein
MTAIDEPVTTQPPAVSTVAYVARGVMVFLVGALLLRVADALVPSWLGEPRAVVHYASMQAAERDLGTRLMVPVVFPDRLVWPPVEIMLTPGADRPVRMTFRAADGSSASCVIAQTLDGTSELPAGLLAPGDVDAHVAISRDPNHPVVVQTVRTPDGTTWREATSLVQNRRVVIRLVDADDTVLLRMVRSLRRGRV